MLCFFVFKEEFPRIFLNKTFPTLKVVNQVPFLILFLEIILKIKSKLLAYS